VHLVDQAIDNFSGISFLSDARPSGYSLRRVQFDELLLGLRAASSHTARNLGGNTSLEFSSHMPLHLNALFSQAPLRFSHTALRFSHTALRFNALFSLTPLSFSHTALSFSHTALRFNALFSQAPLRFLVWVFLLITNLCGKLSRIV
jgi:hypothetical protein